MSSAETRVGWASWIQVLTLLFPPCNQGETWQHSKKPWKGYQCVIEVNLCLSIKELADELSKHKCLILTLQPMSGFPLSDRLVCILAKQTHLNINPGKIYWRENLQGGSREDRSLNIFRSQITIMVS